VHPPLLRRERGRHSRAERSRRLRPGGPADRHAALRPAVRRARALQDRRRVPGRHVVARASPGTRGGRVAPGGRMQRIVLGRTGLEISRIGFGAWAAGGTEWFHGWSGQTDDDSLAAIGRAVELGVDWIDTAAAYGFGHSEEIVGRALDGVRRRPYLFTKCSVLPGPPGPGRWSLRPDSIGAEAQGSRRRLRTDRIDLYQIHGPRPVEQIEEGWSTLAELKEEGVVGHIGVSNFTVEQLRRIEEIAPVETLQP